VYFARSLDPSTDFATLRNNTQAPVRNETLPLEPENETLPVDNATWHHLTTNATWNAELFVRLVRRAPPPNYDRWTRFVLENQCDKNLARYLHLEQLFDYWYARGGISRSETKTVLGGRWESSVLRVEYRNGTMFGPNHSLLLQFHRVFHLLPPKDFSFIARFHDEPASLPSNRTIISVADLRAHPCIVQHYAKPLFAANATYLDLHGYFLAPNLLPSAVTAPMLSATRLPVCTLDIPVPLTAHAKQLARDYRDPVPWSKKYDVLYHRGSLSGGLFNRPQWQQYHRVRLLTWAKQYLAKHNRSSINGTDLNLDQILQNYTKSDPFYIDIGMLLFSDSFSHS
jgi:hypothetical protein